MESTQEFKAKQFNIGELKGISAKNIEEHLKLYVGYVKHANLILAHIDELSKDSEKYAYELGELQRRFSFEFCGMRNHEYYFSSLENGATEIKTDGELYKELEKTFGSFDAFITRFKQIAMTRGVGWAILYWDPETKRLLTQWVDEQHLGHLNSCVPILALDMWEHSFVFDYQPSGKKNYVEDFFANLNWSVIENNFKTATE
jgi:Fe-Mn family superoxide dismutase